MPRDLVCTRSDVLIKNFVFLALNSEPQELNEDMRLMKRVNSYANSMSIEKRVRVDLLAFEESASRGEGITSY